MRLAVYFLIDNSASMFGAPIQAAVDAYQRLCVELDQGLRGTVAVISTLIFDSQVKVVGRQQPVASLPLNAVRVSNQGRAWRQLTEWLTTDIFDHALAFLFTDGPGTDDWIQAVVEVPRDRVRLYGIGCGYKANLDLLIPYLDETINWSHFDLEQFRIFLQQYEPALRLDDG